MPANFRTVGPACLCSHGTPSSSFPPQDVPSSSSGNPCCDGFDDFPRELHVHVHYEDFGRNITGEWVPGGGGDYDLVLTGDGGFGWSGPFTSSLICATIAGCYSSLGVPDGHNPLDLSLDPAMRVARLQLGSIGFGGVTTGTGVWMPLAASCRPLHFQGTGCAYGGKLEDAPGGFDFTHGFAHRIFDTAFAFWRCYQAEVTE